MKKLLILLLALILIAPTAFAKEHYAGDAVVDDDVEGFVITAWDRESMWDGHTADYLIIQYTAGDRDFPLPDEITDESMIEYADEAWHWAEANRGYGDFVVAKLDDEDFLRFCYDGTTEEESTADGAYYDYTSHRYSGATEGQVKRIYAVNEDRVTAYIMYYCEAAGVHNAIRVDWIPDDDTGVAGSWHISRFYRDNVQDYKEMEICARFGYYDYVGGVKVTTEKSSLNVRAWPGGDIVGSLKKGSEIEIYRCEEPAEDGTPFTLIAKWTEPDAEGYSTLEYFGWVASEYITESPNWVWVYGD